MLKWTHIELLFNFLFKVCDVCLIRLVFIEHEGLAQTDQILVKFNKKKTQKLTVERKQGCLA